ncbi:hypothetical protein OHA77_31245 [Streptosporangium sp. NBC_01639]|uniref:hypothetical protein n=1 Tax=Streptosporangium sp. NBC_01639 TaxID=2975948 RepID=UPI00387019EE|nr:hypothetical protein OHA77_31245 [Streptosporangium sp. NBC_01639]
MSDLLFANGTSWTGTVTTDVPAVSGGRVTALGKQALRRGGRLADLDSGAARVRPPHRLVQHRGTWMAGERIH